MRGDDHVQETDVDESDQTAGTIIVEEDVAIAENTGVEGAEACRGEGHLHLVAFRHLQS